MEHLGLGLLLQVCFGHGVDVQFGHFEVGHFGLVGHARVLLVRAGGLLAHFLALVLVDVQFAKVVDIVVVDLNERTADSGLVLRLQFL